MKGLVSLKQKLLGWSHPGQDLVVFRIVIWGETIRIFREVNGKRETYSKNVSAERTAILLQKLRERFRKGKGPKRWVIAKAGLVTVLSVAYPSKKWEIDTYLVGTLNCGSI